MLKWRCSHRPGPNTANISFSARAIIIRRLAVSRHQNSVRGEQPFQDDDRRNHRKAQEALASLGILRQCRASSRSTKRMLSASRWKRIIALRLLIRMAGADRNRGRQSRYSRLRDGRQTCFQYGRLLRGSLDYSEPLPDRLLHPRRILDGVRRGVEARRKQERDSYGQRRARFRRALSREAAGLLRHRRFMPRKTAGVACETKEIVPGDRICMVGGRIGKDGIHGATFSSLALDEASPVSAVQLGDPITQKRMADFLLEARIGTLPRDHG